MFYLFLLARRRKDQAICGKVRPEETAMTSNYRHKKSKGWDVESEHTRQNDFGQATPSRSPRSLSVWIQELTKIRETWRHKNQKQQLTAINS